MSDGAWKHLKPPIPAHVQGKQRTVSMRQIVNAVFHVLKTGCQWRCLPREYPEWAGRCTTWSRDGTWGRLHGLLRSMLREKTGRHKHPAAGCLDSQCVKCTAVCPWPCR